jgi:PAS domain-containing protein
MNRNFPDRLKSVLAERGETNASLARAIDVTPQAVSKWLRGGDVGYETLVRMASHLGVNWVWLRYGPMALEALQKESEATASVELLRRDYLTEVMDNEQRHQRIFQMLELGVFDENPITGTAYWSPITRRLLGAPPELEATHENFRALVLEEDQPAVDALHSSILLGSENRVIFTFRVTAFPTEILYGHTVIERDDAGRPVRMMGVLKRRNLTEEKQP